MSLQLSVDDISSISKGQISLELAAALGMKSIPLSTYHSLAGLDTLANSYAHERRQSHGYPSEHGYLYTHDQSAFLPMPSAFTGSNIAMHNALTDTFVPSSLAQRAPSPPVHFPIRWPAADEHYTFPPSQPSISPTLAQGVHAIPPAPPVASHAHDVYQSHTPDARRSAAQPAWSVSGSLDPVTGIFQRSPDHPRLRTAQACEKCRIRKAKCSGEHPSCQRCRSRGLLCEYAPERRMRGPNKKKRGELSTAEHGSSTPDTDRRNSVASSSSSSEADHAYRFPPIAASSSPVSVSPVASVPSPPSALELLQPHSLPAEQPRVPSPLRFSTSATADASGPTIPYTSPPTRPVAGLVCGRRPRPPPLDLGDAAFPAFQGRLHPLTPQYLPPVIDDITPTYAARRASLPTYILEAHAQAEPRLGMDFNFDLDIGLSPFYSHSRSNSASDASGPAPLTPLELPQDMLGAHGRLTYPDDRRVRVEVSGDEHGVAEAESSGFDTYGDLSYHDDFHPTFGGSLEHDDTPLARKELYLATDPSPHDGPHSIQSHRES
ncbi:predicted protein [Postia placenta Mad-698-R]|uniref:Zn(2)-C6 fungal-type domain-containing protein n=1 Tax=Postia placenta MAD-698-R-SB12 TaxID=670580 RepID=A0A1X6NHY8_9APHY|nr:hypothetical protein POSPLADRAFT_1052291 [Postia placenta MAD-698-R-SB12]EED85773.1 predicted protein [Postia placenta Mad-698-R]OSX68162.1 hypothetical protein POSPLADRAFT_1052291 [Postia placenta MAD-698-R-SB12]